jgi:hypothetical protein
VRHRYIGVTHLSDSAVQREAEAMIVDGLGAQLGVGLLPGGRLQVGGGAHVQVDARSENGGVLVEAHARQGALKGAQLKKVGQDILKFALFASNRGVGRSANDSRVRQQRGQGVHSRLGSPGSGGIATAPKVV